MTNPAGPWSLIRQMWTRNFKQNPAGTVISSLLAVAGVGFMLFFGFFIFMALVVVGGLFMLAQALLGGSGRTSVRMTSRSRVSTPENRSKTSNNNELEGEFTVVSDETAERR